MNKIEKLLEELCPNGVEWKELGEVCGFYSGLSGKNKKDFENGNKKYITYKNIFNNLVVDFTDLEYVRCDEFENQNRVMYGDLLMTGSSESLEDVGRSAIFNINTSEEVYLNSFCFGIRFDLKQYNPEFLKYLFNSDIIRKKIKKSSSGVTRYNISKERLKKIKIPIPPLEVQEEIVKILDKLTEYVTELQAELQLREKQYTYFREKLLNFDNSSSGGANYSLFNIEWKTLGEICDVRDGTHNTPSKQNVGKYLITSKNIKNGAVTFENAYYISEIDFELINKRSKVDINDLLFTMIGTVGEIAHITDEPDYAIKNLGLIKTSDRILSRYLFHYLQTSNAKKYISENKSKGSQVFLSLGKIRNFPIPYVNSNIQSRIVEVLDNFEAICKDLNIGLPKEIELRQKQYEFYREKLLTFDGEYGKPKLAETTITD